MASVNRVTLIGNLTRDPQTKFLPSQMPVCEFGLAMNRKYRTAAGEDREEVCFVDCAAFGKQAEILQQYCQKGKLIYIDGRLKYDTWEDKQGGGKRNKLSVVIENFQFLGGRDSGGAGSAGGADSGQAEGGYGGGGGGGGNRGGGGYQRPPQRSAPNRPPVQQSAAPEPAFDDAPQIDSDDIPF